MLSHHQGVNLMSILTQCCHFHHRHLHVSRFNNLFQVLHITDKSNTHFFVNAMMNFSLLAAHPHRSFWFFLCKLYMKRCAVIAWYTDSILFSFFTWYAFFSSLSFCDIYFLKSSFSSDWTMEITLYESIMHQWVGTVGPYYVNVYIHSHECHGLNISTFAASAGLLTVQWVLSLIAVVLLL